MITLDDLLRDSTKSAAEHLFNQYPSQDLGLANIDVWRRWGIPSDCLRTPVIKLIMASPAAEGHSQRKPRSSSTGPTDTLLIVESSWRHVRHHHRQQCSDVDPRLHCGRDAQEIDTVN